MGNGDGSAAALAAGVGETSAAADADEDGGRGGDAIAEGRRPACTRWVLGAASFESAAHSRRNPPRHRACMQRTRGLVRRLTTVRIVWVLALGPLAPPPPSDAGVRRLAIGTGSSGSATAGRERRVEGGWGAWRERSSSRSSSLYPVSGCLWLREY